MVNGSSYTDADVDSVPSADVLLFIFSDDIPRDELGAIVDGCLVDVLIVVGGDTVVETTGVFHEVVAEELWNVLEAWPVVAKLMKKKKKTLQMKNITIHMLLLCSLSLLFISNFDT